MSQKRQAVRDRLEAHNDYQGNQKTEEDDRSILDHLAALPARLPQTARTYCPNSAAVVDGLPVSLERHGHSSNRTYRSRGRSRRQSPRTTHGSHSRRWQ